MAAVVAISMVLIALSGCGSSLPSVQGTVTYKGQPVTQGQVAFHPKGRGVVGYATIQPDGQFSAQTGEVAGLSEGDYDVTVVSVRAGQPTRDNPVPGVERLVPEKYSDRTTSGLTITVKAGKNDCPLSLAE